MKSKQSTARVLVAVLVHGIALKPNDVIEADDTIIEDLQADGNVDTDPKAVAFCTKTLGKKTIKLESPNAAPAALEPNVDKQTLEEEIKQLEADLDSAAGPQKADIQGKLQAKKVKLAAL